MKMNYLLLILTGCILLSGMSVLADDILLSSAQSDYYYLTGTDAQVPFTIENALSNTLAGNLQYSLTEHQDQGGLSVSRTSTQSQSFPIAPGKSNHALSLTSETKTDYDLSLLLFYNQNGKDYATVLPTISVHFVSNSSEIIEEKQTVRSTTSEATKTSSSSSQADPFSAMDEQMEQMRQEQEQMMQNLMSQSSTGMSSTQQETSQNPQQALQNNQMSSSSSALQQQLTEESKQAKKDKEKLSESLENDPLIKQQASELHNAGYNQTNGKLVPTGPDKGEISVDFENKNGDQISVKGKAENNKVSTLKTEKSGEIPVPDELASNETWNEMKNSVRNSSMTPTSGSITRTPDNTTVSQQYTSPDGRNATISAKIVNGTVEKVTLDKDEAFPIFWMIGIFLVIILIVLCAGVAFWYYSTRKEEVSEIPELIIPPRDYREIVREIMENAEKAYKSGEKKDGYILLGQAIRTFVSSRYGTGEALTSDEIISGTAGFIIPEKDQIHTMLNACSKVEYIRGEPKDDEFYRMLAEAKEIMDIFNTGS